MPEEKKAKYKLHIDDLVRPSLPQCVLPCNKESRNMFTVRSLSDVRVG